MPPKPAKDQTKSTPTNKSANEKDTIKGLKKLVDSLEKEKETWEKKLKEKDEEIERLKVVSTPAANGTTGEVNIQDQSKEIKRANEKDTIKGLKKLVDSLDKEKRTWEKKLKEKDQEIERLKVVQGFCREANNVSTITNSRDLRSAASTNATTGEGNIQGQSKENKRLTEENKELKEELNESLFEDETSKTAAQVPVPDSETLMNDLLERNKRLVVENSELKEQIKKFEFKNQRQKDEMNRLHAVQEIRNTKLNERIKKLEETQSQKENTDSKQIEEKMKEINHLKYRLYEAEKKNSDLKKQIEELQKTQSQEKERKEKPSAEDKKNLDLIQKIKDLENKLSQQEHESKDKLSRVEQEKLNLKRECEELQKTLSQKENDNKSKLKEKDKENSKLSKTIDELQTDIAQLKMANTKLMEEKIKVVKEVDNLKNRLAERDKENSQLTKTINDLQTEKEQLKKTNKSNSPKSAASRDLKDAEAQVKQLKEKNEKLIEEKNKAVREVDNLKNRPLGSKIYRPVELAERFSEVYDNEWTDALEELLEKINNEKAVIQILLHIVMDAYQFCTEKAETFYGSLKGAVSQTFKTMTLTATQLKVMNDYRIATAEHLVTNLQEEFCRANKFDEGSVTHYQNACIRVCWLLAVQDPPVFMDVKENATGAKFDSDKYKCYTKTGNVVDYIVWPVLCLQKGGSLLSKGIVQPK